MKLTVVNFGRGLSRHPLPMALPTSRIYLGSAHSCPDRRVLKSQTQVQLCGPLHRRDIPDLGSVLEHVTTGLLDAVLLLVEQVLVSGSAALVGPLW
jgi:hypothetical protein